METLEQRRQFEARKAADVINRYENIINRLQEILNNLYKK